MLTQEPYCRRNIASYTCQVKCLTEREFDSRSALFFICLGNLPVSSMLQRLVRTVTWHWQYVKGKVYLKIHILCVLRRVICSVNKQNLCPVKLLLRHWPHVAVMPSNSAWSSIQLLPPVEARGNSCNKTGKKEENIISLDEILIFLSTQYFILLMQKLMINMYCTN